VRNGQITNEVLDATEAALCMVGGNQVSLSNLTSKGTFALFFFSLCFIKSSDMPFEWELFCSCVGD